MNTPTVMVQIADYEWTTESIHTACRIARKSSATVVLVQMIPVQHVGLLGSDFGYLELTTVRQNEMANYQDTIEDYGLACKPILFQYVSWLGGTLEIIQHVNSSVVFIKKPQSLIPFFSRYQTWVLKHQMDNDKRQWISHPIYSEVATTGDSTLLQSHASV